MRPDRAHFNLRVQLHGVRVVTMRSRVAEKVVVLVDIEVLPSSWRALKLGPCAQQTDLHLVCVVVGVIAGLRPGALCKCEHLYQIWHRR